MIGRSEALSTSVESVRQLRRAGTWKVRGAQLVLACSLRGGLPTPGVTNDHVFAVSTVPLWSWDLLRAETTGTKHQDNAVESRASHQMELEFAKICYADKPDMERVVFNLGEFALTACQPRSR
jgi:hypothetical protein